MTEGGWDRPHDRARTLGERDSKLRAIKVTTTSAARMATSPTMMKNMPLVLTVSAIGSNRRDDGEDARPGWSVWGGCFS
jgi:hypothetical protein